MINPNKWHNAYVRWFDNLTGVGIVSVPSLNRQIKVHYSAALYAYTGNKSLAHRFDFITYEQLDRVQVRIHQEDNWTQVSHIRKAEWISYTNLVSDLLLKFLKEDPEDAAPGYRDWHDFILNNLICLCVKVRRK